MKEYEKDLVSVIVPVYNVKPEYLHECLDSLVKQSYKKLEIMLIDDGSTNGNGDICDQYAYHDERIQVIHKTNAGVSFSRNVGLEKARGEFVCFVDADDYIDLEYISRMRQEIIDADIVCTGHTKIFPNQQEKHDAHNYHYKYNMDVLGTVWGKLYRREIIGKSRFDIELTHCEDVAFNFEVLKGARYHYVFDNGYFYRYVMNSAVHKFDAEMLGKYRKVIQKVQNQSLDQDQMAAYHTFVCTVYRVLVENYILPQKKRVSEKIRDIRKLASLEEFRESIQKIQRNDMSITRGLPVFCAKYKLYFLTYFIVNVRKYQYKLYSKRG